MAVGATVAVVVDGAGVVRGELSDAVADAGVVMVELGAGVDGVGVAGAVLVVQPLKATPSIKATSIKAATPSLKAATACNGAFALTAAPSGPSVPAPGAAACHTALRPVPLRIRLPLRGAGVTG
ncbi:MAG: hypothetical protein JWO93_870 [Micrococcaceae bacterium]|nr:hypothetical protein [Micrococcaceae bacterium]